MNSAILLLRAAQLGIAMSDLQLLSVGMIMDMCVEAGNDQHDYARIATQEDFDKF